MEQVIVYKLGQIDYQQAWDLQKHLADLIAREEHAPALLLLEHPHVYTFGRQGSAENLLWNDAQLQEKGIDVHWIDRGGDVTYHGPGQLVGYPILPLTKRERVHTGKGRHPRIDFVGYLRDLEKTLIKMLFGFRIGAGQIAGQTGVWVQPDVLSRCVHCPPDIKQSPAKIASIGVKVNVRGITQHGFAFNINPDMNYWRGIVACGLENQNKVSLAHLMQPVPTIDEVVAAYLPGFAKVFDVELVEREPVLIL